MKNIPFYNILQKAWDVTRKQKSLWFLGFFVALGTGNINIHIPQLESQEDQMTFVKQLFENEILKNIFSSYIILLIFGFLLFIFIISAVIEGVLIRLIHDRVIKDQNESMQIVLRKYKDELKNIVLIKISILFIKISTIVLLFLPVLYTTIKHGEPFIMLTLFAIIIFLVINIGMYFIEVYSLIYSMLGRISVSESFQNAYYFFIRNIKESTLLGIIVIGLEIFVAIGTIIGVSIAIIPLTIIQQIFNTGGNVVITDNSIHTTSFVLNIVFYLFLQSLYIIFVRTVWILFMKNIAQKEKSVIIEGLLKSNLRSKVKAQDIESV